MLMPKAAVNENDELVPGKDQVRLPWQVTPMQPEAEAHRMQKPPHNQLWLSVGRSDARHQRTSFRIYYQCLSKIWTVASFLKPLPGATQKALVWFDHQKGRLATFQRKNSRSKSLI
jgi:hypothetical protein